MCVNKDPIQFSVHSFRSAKSNNMHVLHRALYSYCTFESPDPIADSVSLSLLARSLLHYFIRPQLVCSTHSLFPQNSYPQPPLKTLPSEFVVFFPLPLFPFYFFYIKRAYTRTCTVCITSTCISYCLMVV